MLYIHTKQALNTSLFLFVQVGISSTEILCHHEMSFVRWSFLIFRPRWTCTTKTSREVQTGTPALTTPTPPTSPIPTRSPPGLLDSSSHPSVRWWGLVWKQTCDSDTRGASSQVTGWQQTNTDYSNLFKSAECNCEQHEMVRGWIVRRNGIQPHQKHSKLLHTHIAEDSRPLLPSGIF